MQRITSKLLYSRTVCTSAFLNRLPKMWCVPLHFECCCTEIINLVWLFGLANIKNVSWCHLISVGLATSIRSHEDVGVPEKFRQMNFLIKFILHAMLWQYINCIKRNHPSQLCGSVVLVPDGMWDSLKLFLMQCHHYSDVQLCALRLEEVILTAPWVTGVWFCICLLFFISY